MLHAGTIIHQESDEINSMQALALTPPELLIVVVAFLVSIWNTSIGPSGAITFVTMATFLPPTAVVPIHAVTETAANAIRTTILRDLVDWRFVAPFSLGGFLGFAAGASTLSAISPSEDLLRIMLGTFILVATWIPLARLAPERGLFATAGGAISSFLTMFVGATSPLVAAVIGQRHGNHQRVIGTLAGCMLYQHSLKIPIFVGLGFSFATYSHLLCFLVAATMMGSWIGKMLLSGLPLSPLKHAFRLIITLLALNLIRQGLLPAFQ